MYGLRESNDSILFRQQKQVKTIQQRNLSNLINSNGFKNSKLFTNQRFNIQNIIKDGVYIDIQLSVHKYKGQNV